MTVRSWSDADEHTEGTRSFTVGPLGANDSSSALECGSYSDKTYHVYGTFSGITSWALQGSNNGSTWIVLKDTFGNDISSNAEGGDVILANFRYIRIVVTGGNGSTAIYLIVYGRKPSNGF